MKYKTIDGKTFTTRRKVRDYLQSVGLGKNIKENYIPIPENTNDHESIKLIEEYKNKAKRFDLK